MPSVSAAARLDANLGEPGCARQSKAMRGELIVDPVFGSEPGGEVGLELFVLPEYLPS